MANKDSFIHCRTVDTTRLQIFDVLSYKSRNPLGELDGNQLPTRVGN